MLRFGSALARGSQHFGNRERANAGCRELIKRTPGQRLSSPSGMNTVGASIPGRLGRQTLERHNPKVRRSFLWPPGLNFSFGSVDMEKTND
jgi:hypothetical protein